MVSSQNLALGMPQVNPTPADTKTNTNPDPETRKIYKNMTTKGAAAEGARPLCGAAEGRPRAFSKLCVSAVYVLNVFPYVGSRICSVRVL